MKLPIRSMFIAPQGKLFLAFDFSQAETWIVAFSARENNMKSALIHGDIHTLTATVIFETTEDKIDKQMRYAGKRCNHALAYRMSPERMCQVVNADAQDSGLSITLAQAKVFHKRWHEFYQIKKWWGELEHELKSTRRIRTSYGRIRTFYGRLDDELFKQATAHKPQSTVADHALGCVHPEVGIKGGVIEVYRRFNNYNDINVIHTAHDSVMMEVPTNLKDEIAPQVYKLLHRPIVEQGEMFHIPVDCEYGERWMQFEKVDKQTIQSWN